MLRERGVRLLRRPRSEEEIGVARRRHRAEEPHLRHGGRSGQHGDGGPQPQRGAGREERQERLHRVERGQIEHQPVEVFAQLQGRRGQRADAAEDGNLQSARAARLVASAQDGALARLDRLEQPQRLFLPGEGPVARRQRGGTQLLQRIEGLEAIAVDLAQELHQGQLARAAEPRILGSIPAVETRQQRRLARLGGPRGRVAGVLAAVQRTGATNLQRRSVGGAAAVGGRGRDGDVHGHQPRQEARRGRGGGLRAWSRRVCR